MKAGVKDVFIFQLFKFTLARIVSLVGIHTAGLLQNLIFFFLIFFSFFVASFGWTMLFKWQMLPCGHRNFFQGWIKETSGQSEGIALCLAATLLILKMNHYRLYLPVALILLS